MTERDATDPAQRPIGLPQRTAGPSLWELLDALPPDTLLPVRWIQERLSLEPHADGGRHDTLSAQEFGARRRPTRTADWVRQQCAEGRIEGAFKDGGEWRVPRSALVQAPAHRVDSRGSAQSPDASAAPPRGTSRYPRW